MSGHERIPSALQPYICALPEASLCLITGVLEATPHWLTTRLVQAVAGRQHDTIGHDAQQTTNGAVVLVSWLRDWEYWRSEAKRGVLCDFEKLKSNGQLAFIDGLSQLFTPAESSNQVSGDRQRTTASPIAARSILPDRSRPVPATVKPKTDTNILSNSALTTATRAIKSAIDSLLQRGDIKQDVTLILDSPTTLLATTDITSRQLCSFITELRCAVHSTVVVCEADTPFLAPASSDDTAMAHASLASPLETEHAALIVTLAHQARLIMGTRPLDTGTARDISGVLQVSRGAAWDETADTDPTSQHQTLPDARGVELLYHAMSDGRVTVFERGSTTIG